MNKKRIAIGIAALSFIVACGTNNYKPNSYDYQLNKEALQKETIKSVLIADINYLQPSRRYLNKKADFVDAQLEQFLLNRNVKVISNRVFTRQWDKKKTRFGNTYDANTGQQTSHFTSALTATLEQVFTSRPQLDAIIFTDLLSVSIEDAQSSMRTVQWHGVSRKVKVQGLGDGNEANIDWIKSINGISLAVHIINREQQQVLENVGGIQVAQTLNLQNKFTKLKRRKDLLQNENEIEEGIQLALQPWLDYRQQD